MVSMVILVVEIQVSNYKKSLGLDRNLFFTAMEKSRCFQIRNIDCRIYIYGECSVRVFEQYRGDYKFNWILNIFGNGIMPSQHKLG